MLCRLYWFITKVIYSTMHISVLTFPNGPYYLLFNPLLWALFAMQVKHIVHVIVQHIINYHEWQAYWFKFIVRLLWKILVLGEELEDTREYEEKTEGEEKKEGEGEGGKGKDQIRKKKDAKKQD